VVNFLCAEFHTKTLYTQVQKMEKKAEYCLMVSMIDDEMFKVSCQSATRPLTEHKAKLLAEALRRQDMFDEIRVEQLH
jgi:hypothetical protein